MNFHPITSPLIFYGLFGLLFGYLLYTMIRRRKGERPGQEGRESEL